MNKKRGCTESSSSINNKKRKGVFCHSWRDWAWLPVLSDVLNRLTVIDDYVRFGAVCTSWRTIFVEESGTTNAQKRCSQPFLLVGSPQAKDSRMVLYSLSTETMYNFDVQLNFGEQVTDSRYCRGSSFGWLITMEIKGVDNYHFQLQNPFLSSAIIDLPPLNNIVKQYPDPKLDVEHYSYHSLYLMKAVLSSSPSSSDDFLIAAIMSPCNGLAVLDSRQTAWVPLGDWKIDQQQNRKIDDVIFFTKTQQFYAVRHDGEVLAVALHGGRPELVQVMPPPGLYRNCFRVYLAEDLSSGELLHIYKFLIIREESLRIYFRVVKLDPVDKNRISASDLSGKVLFLGNNASTIRSALDCPGCKPNSVYYTEDIMGIPSLRGYGLPHDGVYNLVDGTSRPHYSIVNAEEDCSPPSIWVEPTLQK